MDAVTLGAAAAKVGGFLLKYWKWVAIAALLAAVGVQSARLDQARRDQLNPATGGKWRVEAKRDAKALALAVGDLGRCRDNVGELKASLNAQNAAVDRWKAEGQARAAEAEKAARDARGARAVAESRARDLAALKSAASCPEREAAIRDIVKGVTR